MVLVPIHATTVIYMSLNTLLAYSHENLKKIENFYLNYRLVFHKIVFESVI